jgi:Uma2 family endonuclease
MNEQLRRPSLPLTSQAAEGLPRRRWSVAEVEAAAEAGVLADDERFELIGGEMVPMNPKGIRHERIKSTLNLYWAQRLPPEIRFATETTFRMSEDTFVEPDFVFFRSVDGLAGLTPATALLAVEVAETSLAYDLGRKIAIYASFGVREVWVIDAATLLTHVHCSPGGQRYASIRVIDGANVLSPDFAPGLAVTLGALELV